MNIQTLGPQQLPCPAGESVETRFPDLLTVNDLVSSKGTWEVRTSIGVA